MINTVDVQSAPTPDHKRERALRKHRLRQRRYLERKRKAQCAAERKQRQIEKAQRGANAQAKQLAREARIRSQKTSAKPPKIDDAFARGYAAGFQDGKRFAVNQ